jgi:hypothetical protein
MSGAFYYNQINDLQLVFYLPLRQDGETLTSGETHPKKGHSLEFMELCNQKPIIKVREKHNDIN